MTRVVIYRLGSLGDTVVALPCLHKIADVFPDAERVALTNIPVSAKAAPLEAVLAGSGLVHRALAYPVGTRSFKTLAALRRSLLELQADTLVVLMPARGQLSAWRDWLFFKLCGFKRIVGLALSADLQRNRRTADGREEPEAERLARCIAALGPVELRDPAAWNLHLTEAEHQAGAMALGRVGKLPRIAVNMGCKVPENDWGEANWLALVRLLRESWSDHALVFIGAAEDRARATRVGAEWPGPVVNLCGGVAPRVSAAAMAGSRCFIGHDSGPLHLASCTGVRCVGLYGNHNQPGKWHPCGSGHQIVHEMRGMPAIDVDRVHRAVQTLLTQAGRERPPSAAPHAALGAAA